MGIFSGLLSDAFGGLVGQVGNIIDNLHTSGEEKEKLKLAHLQMQIEANIKAAEIESKLEELTAKDLADQRSQIKAEIASEDWYVRRNRPTFNYIFYLILLANYLIYPLWAYFTGSAPDPISLPAELWYIFGLGFVGYAYLRTLEKTGHKPPFSK